MKKMLAIVLALVMVLGLFAACSPQGGANNETTAANNEGTLGVDPGFSDEGPDGTTAADAALTTIAEGKLTMSTNAAFPPYEMTTDDGGFEGIDVEIAEAIAQKVADKKAAEAAAKAEAEAAETAETETTEAPAEA